MADSNTNHPAQRLSAPAMPDGPATLDDVMQQVWALRCELLATRDAVMELQRMAGRQMAAGAPVTVRG